MERPSPNEYSPYHAGYIALVPDGDVIAMMRAQADELAAIAGRVPRDRETFAYAPEKWSVRQVFGHLGDGERIFAYRALCVSRGDVTPLPGFDENFYVAHANFASRPLSDLTDELLLTRRANVRMFESFDDATWRQTGNANGAPVTVNAIAWIITGHTRHHLNVLRDRYGVS